MSSLYQHLQQDSNHRRIFRQQTSSEYFNEELLNIQLNLRLLNDKKDVLEDHQKVLNHYYDAFGIGREMTQGNKVNLSSAKGINVDSGVINY